MIVDACHVNPVVQNVSRSKNVPNAKATLSLPVRVSVFAQKDLYHLGIIVLHVQISTAVKNATHLRSVPNVKTILSLRMKVNVNVLKNL